MPWPSSTNAIPQPRSTFVPRCRPAPTARTSPTPSHSSNGSCDGASRVGGLEQLGQVAGRVDEQALGATRAGDDLVAELEPGLTQPIHLGGEVGDDEVDAV